MTTNVTVNAHCGSNKEVLITRTDSADVVIQDGEKYDHVVYDDVVITVKEVLKSQ